MQGHTEHFPEFSTSHPTSNEALLKSQDSLRVELYLLYQYLGIKALWGNWTQAFQIICRDTQKQAYFQALFYNQLIVIKTQSWIKVWNSMSSCFCFFSFLFLTLKDFSFYSSILLTTLWFRYLQTRIKESYMYRSSQRFFKTPHKTLKFREKPKKNAFSSDLQS